MRAEKHKDLSKLRVLVVEDNRYFARILKTILRSVGVPAVFEAEDGFVALEMLSDQDIDLVITDLEIPGIDGAELIRIIRSAADIADPDMPILVVSAYAERARVMAAIEAGADAYAIKPLSAHTLLRKIIALRNRTHKAA